MERTLAAGGALTAVGIGGYLLGIRVSYPGRAFSVTAVMIGITLLAIAADRGESA